MTWKKHENVVWVRPCVHNLPFMSGNCTDIILKLFSPNRISNLLFLSGEGTFPIPLDLHCPFLFLHLHHLKNLLCIKLKEHYLTKEIDLIENQHKKRAFNTLIFWVHWCCSLEKWIIIPQQRDNWQGNLAYAKLLVRGDEWKREQAKLEEVWEVPPCFPLPSSLFYFSPQIERSRKTYWTSISLEPLKVSLTSTLVWWSYH